MVRYGDALLQLYAGNIIGRTKSQRHDRQHRIESAIRNMQRTIYNEKVVMVVYSTPFVCY